MSDPEYDAVLKLLEQRMPKGYEVVDNRKGTITFQVPLETYPDTYNKRPLMYVALAAQKNYNSLHLLPAYASETITKKIQDGFTAAGKKLDMGKGCVRFKKAADLDLDVIGDVVASFPPEKWIAKMKEMHGKRA